VRQLQRSRIGKNKISHYCCSTPTGGGIIGCTAAYYLTRHASYDSTRHRITLLEATKIASNASGKAGGLVALWAYPRSIVPLSFKLHEELAREHNGEERWGYRRIHAGELAAQAENETRRTDSETPARARRLGAAGIPDGLTWVDPSTVVSYSELGNPTNTAQVHPYRFTTSMAELAAEKGVKIVLGSVTGIEYTTVTGEEAAAGGGQPLSPKKNTTPTKAVSGVTYTDTATSIPHTIPATTVILAAGPWTPTLLPSLAIPAHRAHSITVRPTTPISAHALFTDLPPSTPEIYPRPNNEAYACGPTDTLVPLPATSALIAVDPERCADIKRQISTISPALRDGEVLVEQACYLPGGGPWVGATGRAQGEWVAAGHTCWGISNAPATGSLLAEMVFEGKARSANAASLNPKKGMVG
jgi:glycine/D-amino acid oxidase-like deaminating enzyme